MSLSRTVLPASLSLAVLLLLGGCASSGAPQDDGRVQVVASFYPLAWAAEQVGGDRVQVTDLTPPGGEAHDATLTATERAQLSEADLITIHGNYGFQPVIEEAATQTDTPILMLIDDDHRTATFDNVTGQVDPHLWLQPFEMRSFVDDLAAQLGSIDPAHRDEYLARADAVKERIRALSVDVELPCSYDAAVTSHEAFWFLLQGFGNEVVPTEQFGIEGATPEGEPSADRVQAAIDAIEDGVAPRAVFYEPTDEGLRVARAVAADAGAATVPLNPLESKPEQGDYLSVMQDNYDTLTKWMGC